MLVTLLGISILFNKLQPKKTPGPIVDNKELAKKILLKFYKLAALIFLIGNKIKASLLLVILLSSLNFLTLVLIIF